MSAESRAYGIFCFNCILRFTTFVCTVKFRCKRYLKKKRKNDSGELYKGRYKNICKKYQIFMFPIFLSFVYFYILYDTFVFLDKIIPYTKDGSFSNISLIPILSTESSWISWTNCTCYRRFKIFLVIRFHPFYGLR